MRTERIFAAPEAKASMDTSPGDHCDDDEDSVEEADYDEDVDSIDKTEYDDDLDSIEDIGEDDLCDSEE